MIPIQLTIEGLYSYQARQTIDFENLTEAGLFGIFGTVGSGKSSILEAISFALYGETERMNSKEKRAYNMMNLKSDKSLIEFEFYNYDNVKYKITRSFKRNSKRFEDVKPADTIFYQFENGDWKPLEHTNAEEIIGLSYVNFKRTIIIPQGQFKEFIELGATDRTKMMKEIFGLQRYDLQDKTSVLYSKTKSDLDQLQGKLSGFETISEEKIELLKNDLKEHLTSETKVQGDFNIINEKFQQLKALKTDFQALQQKKIDFETLHQDKNQKEEQEKQLNHYEETHRTFHPLLTEISKITFDIKTKNSSIESQEKELAEIQKEFETIAEKIKNIQPQFDNLNQQRKVELDLELVADILKFEQELIALEEKTKLGLQFVEDHQKSEKAVVQNIKKEEEELHFLTESKIDSAILMNVDQWFNQYQNLQDSKEKSNKKINDIQQNLAEINAKFSEYQVELSTFEELFKTKFETLESEKKLLLKQRNELEVQQKLSEYTHQLHDGEACPLCGSLEHPHILETEDVSFQLEKVNFSLQNNEVEEKLLKEKWDLLKSFKLQHSHQIQTIKAENKAIETIEKAIQNHIQEFSWKEFDWKDKSQFDEKKKATLDLENTLSEKNKTLKLLREDLEKKRATLQKATDKLAQLKSDEIQKATQISQNKSQIKVINFEEYAQYSHETVLQKLEFLQLENNSIEKEYLNLNDKFNDLKPKLASQKTSIEVLKNQVLKLIDDQNNLNIQINSAISTSNLENIEAVKSILQLQLDVVNIRKTLEDFKIKYVTLKNSIQELEEKLEKVSFDDEAYENHESQFNEISKQLNEAKKLVVETKAEILRLEKEFESKKELLKELAQVEKRSENLKILSNLFKGAGFVQYVSSIYLSQLCDHANVRFNRMTRGQLSLHLNENNDFEIKDYLNEGKSRSVKTLSGGQAFQVSLSLALALAESVQSNAKAEKNFFFIDEGFGTQDAESINIVFETLQSLQKENRIVGIISHVEELKERIPISLQITKDEERGSLIEVIN